LVLGFTHRLNESSKYQDLEHRRKVAERVAAPLKGGVRSPEPVNYVRSRAFRHRGLHARISSSAKAGLLQVSDGIRGCGNKHQQAQSQRHARALHRFAKQFEERLHSAALPALELRSTYAQ